MKQTDSTYKENNFYKLYVLVWVVVFLFWLFLYFYMTELCLFRECVYFIIEQKRKKEKEKIKRCIG